MAKGPFMEFLRAKAVQSTANTYAEIMIPTPTSKTESMAMLIHSIELEPTNVLDTTVNNGDLASMHLSKTHKTSTLGLEDPDILARYRAKVSLNAVFNTVVFQGERKHVFDPPILYPHTNLFLGFYTLGFTAASYGIGRIGYTLEKVSREDFIAALVD